MLVDVAAPRTWLKFNQEMCQTCRGSCCSLPVELNFADLIRLGVVDAFEAEEPRRKIAKRLKKDGIISHYHNKSDIYTLTQLSNGDCLYLDQKSRLCTVYDRRPQTCRNHPKVGPRSGYCAYVKKKEL